MVKAKAGDTAAFGELYTLWYTPVFRFILMRVKSKETAEDITQDVFMKMYAHLDRFELRAAHPLGFLFTTARNAVIDHHKKKKPQSLEALEIGDIEDEAMRDPQENAEIANDTDRLREGMKGLTREQQDVITLRLIEEKSVREVSEIMGRSEEAVRQLQVRALRALRAFFMKYERE